MSENLSKNLELNSEMQKAQKANLDKPSIQYKDSFLGAVKEFQKEGRYTEFDVEQLKEGFDGFLQKFDNEEKGIGLKEGYVPASTFWLVDKGEFIGRVSIRHELTENLKLMGGYIGYDIRPSKRKMGYGTRILELALPIAKELGIGKVLVTCDDDNVGSSKIIEKNGGVLEDKIEVDGKLKRRYWINNP
jgi:predicted acetyltransferase